MILSKKLWIRDKTSSSDTAAEEKEQIEVDRLADLLKLTFVDGKEAPNGTLHSREKGSGKLERGWFLKESERQEWAST